MDFLHRLRSYFTFSAFDSPTADSILAPYAIVDIETTGTNASYNSITEVAIYVHDGNRVVDEWHSLINPQSIPVFISQMTGITNQMVADAPRLKVAQEIFYRAAIKFCSA